MEEAVRWAGALTSLVGLAIATGVSPALYGIIVDLFARGGSPWRPLAWVSAGQVAAATFMFGIMLVINPTAYIAALRVHIDEAVLNFWVDLVAAVLFLGAAAWVAWWRVRSPQLRRQLVKKPTRGGTAAVYFTAGVWSVIIGFTSWPVMYIVSRVVLGVSGDWALRGIAFAVYLAVLVGPFFLLAWVWTRLPRLANTINRVYLRVLAADYRWPLCALLAVAGAVFLLLALRFDA